MYPRTYIKFTRTLIDSWWNARFVKSPVNGVYRIAMRKGVVLVRNDDDRVGWVSEACRFIIYRFGKRSLLVRALITLSQVSSCNERREYANRSTSNHWFDLAIWWGHARAHVWWHEKGGPQSLDHTMSTRSCSRSCWRRDEEKTRRERTWWRRESISGRRAE